LPLTFPERQFSPPSMRFSFARAGKTPWHDSCCALTAMKKILVIDDKQDIRTLIKAVLRNFNFAVIEAEDGQMGLQMLQKHKPDLVVCDINMPGMDGYELLAAVRESLDTASTPFILMTGLVSRDGFRRGMVNGADDYLVKPFTTDELVEAVMSRLARQTDFQIEADRRAQRLHEYAPPHAFPQFNANNDETIGKVAA
jgi:DNA-binding response OmpR family regulator